MLPRSQPSVPIALLLLLALGCSPSPYKPTLHLDETRETVGVVVYQEPLRDLTPPDDRLPSGTHRLVVTAPDRVEGELPALVARAIRSDFSATSVFTYFATTREQADLVLSGTIYRFFGEITLPSWQLVPGLRTAVETLFSDGEQWQGEVNIELTLTTRDGRRVGSYHGQSRYQETATTTANAWSAPLYPAHARLNRAFTDAMVQVRTQLFQDREIIQQYARNRGRPAAAAPQARTP
jgi:hypothetical protein